MTHTPQPLRFTPGIQRDGTRLTAPGNWVDGKWARFVNGRPRKIKGYRQLTDECDGIARSFENYTSGGVNYVHMGSNTNLRQMRLSDVGVAFSPAIRTPGAYTMQGDELWQMQTAYDPIVGNAASLFAHPGRNLNDMTNNVATSIYIGASSSTSALTALSSLTAVSGGICYVHPYLTFFGSDGYFGWSAPNNTGSMTVLNGGGEAYITSQKIVRGFSIRGGNGPAGLYFSLNSLIRTSFIGGTATWAFDTVSDEISLMSSRAMAMDVNDVFYWMGVDTFQMYNGEVAELKNTFNSDWVFDNINRSYRQKCFTFSNRRFGEIWFCFPFGDATECSHAAIYNTRTGEWYDTELPNGGRAGAMPSGLYPYPLMSGVDEVTTGLYRIWEHESGTDEVRGLSTIAIRSFVESSDLTMLTAQQPKNAALTCHGVEPDIKQAGNMTLTITGNANARSADIDDEAITFSPPTVAEDEQILRPKVERRQMRFRWESNVAGGDYEIGLPIAHIGEGSGRATG